MLLYTLRYSLLEKSPKNHPLTEMSKTLIFQLVSLKMSTKREKFKSINSAMQLHIHLEIFKLTQKYLYYIYAAKKPPKL